MATSLALPAVPRATPLCAEVCHGQGTDGPRSQAWLEALMRVHSLPNSGPEEAPRLPVPVRCLLDTDQLSFDWALSPRTEGGLHETRPAQEPPSRICPITWRQDEDLYLIHSSNDFESHQCKEIFLFHFNPRALWPDPVLSTFQTCTSENKAMMAHEVFQTYLQFSVFIIHRGGRGGMYFPLKYIWIEIYLGKVNNNK